MRPTSPSLSLGNREYVGVAAIVGLLSLVVVVVAVVKVKHLYDLCPEAAHRLELVEADLNRPESWPQ